MFLTQSGEEIERNSVESALSPCFACARWSESIQTSEAQWGSLMTFLNVLRSKPSNSTPQNPILLVSSHENDSLKRYEILENDVVWKIIFSEIEFREFWTSNSDSTGTSYYRKCLLFLLIDSIEPVRDEKKDRTGETAHLWRGLAQRQKFSRRCAKRGFVANCLNFLIDLLVFMNSNVFDLPCKVFENKKKGAVSSICSDYFQWSTEHRFTRFWPYSRELQNVVYNVSLRHLCEKLEMKN